MKIRGGTIPYATRKKVEYDRAEKKLESEIDMLEIRVNHSSSVDIFNELQEKKDQLTQLRQKKTEGSRVRARARWST